MAHRPAPGTRPIDRRIATSRCRLHLRVFLVVALGLTLPMAVEAQAEDRVRAVVAGGPTVNDLEVGGLIWLGAAAVEWRPVSGRPVLDSSIRYLTYTAAEREHGLLAEISAQWEVRLGRVRPFVGGGGGLAWRLRPRRHDVSPSYHVAAGLRSALSSKLGIRAEARLRSLDPFGDFTLGLSWDLGSH